MKWLVASLSDFTEEEYFSAYESLSPSRRERIDKKQCEADRLRSLLAEILIKRLLAEEGITASVEADPCGRPYLCGNERYISLSHSGDKAAAVIAESPVGIDIERIREVNPRLKDRVCTAEEREFIDESPDKTTAFFEVWTAKEACFKKQGTGITDLKSVNTRALNRRVYGKDGYIVQIVL